MSTRRALAFILFCVFILLVASSLVFAGVTTRVSVASDGAQCNMAGYYPSTSADGRYVAFQSSSSNLVADDTNGCGDIFVHDRQTGVTERVSVASDGSQGNDHSYAPWISADGRYVSFDSGASSLVPGDTNGRSDVFVHDMLTGQTSRVSVSSSGAQANNDSFRPSISRDGVWIAFMSMASNLVPGDTNNRDDVFVHDRQTGHTTRVSVATDGTQANGGNGLWRVPMSADGRYVAFQSSSSNLVAGDTNGCSDIFVHDRQTGITERVSISSEGTQGDGSSGAPFTSEDGRYVAFVSYASNLVAGDSNETYDVFLHDRQTGVTERVSVASDGTQADYGSGAPSISADGRYMAFVSSASNLVLGDTNECEDVFVRDRQTGQTSRVSVASDGTQVHYDSYDPSITADGRYVAFDSGASNLVPGDTNGYNDVFVHDRWGVGDTKALGDDEAAILSANTVTASLTGAFYAEDADRASGMRVSWAGAVTEGDRYRVDGMLDTDENGERYINASNVRRIDTLSVVPLCLRTDFLGGADDDYDSDTGAGQQGITGAFSLNNIGLFIRTLGKVTQKGSDYLYVNDGAGLLDGTQTGGEDNVGVRVICNPAGYTTGDAVEVKGISSCFQGTSDLARRILTRRSSDVRKITP